MNHLSIITDRERDLAERLEVAEQQRDELAAQVDVMREASIGLLGRYVGLVESGDCGSWDYETEHQVISMRAALALPNTTTAILRQCDARTLLMAAEICSGMFEGQVGGVRVASIRCADVLRAKAAELEAQHG